MQASEALVAAARYEQLDVVQFLLDYVADFSNLLPSERERLIHIIVGLKEGRDLPIISLLLRFMGSAGQLRPDERQQLDAVLLHAGRQGNVSLMMELLRFGCEVKELASYRIPAESYAGLDGVLPATHRGVLATRDWLIEQLEGKRISRSWFPGSMLAEPYYGNNGRDGSALADIVLFVPQLFSGAVGLTLRPAYFKLRDMVMLMVFSLGAKSTQLPSSVKLSNPENFSFAQMEKVFAGYKASMGRAHKMTIDSERLMRSLRQVAFDMKSQNRLFDRKEFDKAVLAALR
jgi:hypothetical protein